MWSPRQLAELADTSRRTVRHYHDLGLLPEPDRQRNGYLRYGVAHLVRLLRIRRLVQLGLSLPQIAAIGDADEHPVAALQTLDRELAATIEQLRQTRLELADMLARATPTDLPPTATEQVRGLPSVERALIVVLSRVLSDDGFQAYLRLLEPYREHTSVLAFDDLPIDADPRRQEIVAAGLAEHLRELTGRHGDLIDAIETDLPRNSGRHRTVQQAVMDLYHPPQLTILHLAGTLNDLPGLVRLRTTAARGVSNGA